MHTPSRTIPTLLAQTSSVLLLLLLLQRLLQLVHVPPWELLAVKSTFTIKSQQAGSRPPPSQVFTGEAAPPVELVVLLQQLNGLLQRELVALVQLFPAPVASVLQLLQLLEQLDLSLGLVRVQLLLRLGHPSRLFSRQLR